VQDRQREILLRALRDENQEVRQAASSALEHLEACADISLLRHALQSGDRHQRVAAAYALEDVHTAEAAALLVELLEDQDEDVRAVAVQGVGMRRERSALSALVQCLKDPSPAVAVHAARALGHFKDKRLVPYLEAMSRSDNSELACACLDSIGAIGDICGLEAGERAASHPDPEVRLSAVRMLGKLQ
jgi:HEAT repeat protein